jgi:hypothetical protein
MPLRPIYGRQVSSAQDVDECIIGNHSSIADGNEMSVNVLGHCAKGPQWRTTRTTLPLDDGSGNIARLAGQRRRLDRTRATLQGKVQKQIVRAAARGNAGSGCCQQKQGHNPAKMATFFTATDISVQVSRWV